MADLECTLGKITPTEIVNAINARVEENAGITPATNTKITYDAKGLVTSGEAATTADIADSTDKRYVTDTEAGHIDNLSGTNTGDNSVNTLYSDLETNVPTALDTGTVTGTSYGIHSDSGDDDIILVQATTTDAGLLSADKWDEIVANSLKETNVTTDLTQTPTTTQVTVHSSDGDDIIILQASDTIAGVMSVDHHDKLDGIEADADVNLDAAGMEALISHDNLQNITAKQHIDWTVDDADVIHSANYTNTTYVSGDFVHDDLNSVAADEHIDWTVDDAKVIHADNYTNTTYDDSDFVDLTTAQSVGGIKTFTAAPVLPSTTIIEVATDTTPQLGGDLDFNGKTMNKSAVRQVADDSGSGTVTFDYDTEDMIQYTATAALTTLTFSNFPSGDVAGYIIDAVDWGNYAITHPGTMLFAAGTAPTYTTDGTDRILVTSDKDGILTLTVIAQDIKAVA